MTTLLTAAQVAERLSISKRSVLRYTADGDLQAYNFQGRNYYDWEEVCRDIKRWAQPNYNHGQTTRTGRPARQTGRAARNSDLLRLP